MKKFLAVAALALPVAFQSVAFAAEAAHQGRGTVRGVDAAGLKVNMQHEAIPSLSWPAMTMDIAVRDRDVLKGVRTGARVDFELVRDPARGYVISRVSPAK